MSPRKTSFALVTSIFCVSLLVAPSETFAQRYRGSSGGQSSGMHWSTGEKIAVVGGLAFGGYLVARSFHNAEIRASNARAQAEAIQYARVSRGHYVSNDDESYDDSDPAYRAYVARLSAEEIREATKKEYAAYQRRNAATFAAARNDLNEAMSKIQATQNSPVICASVCGGWAGFKLHTSAISTGAASGEEGYKILTDQCKADGGILTDGLNPNKQGSASISLTVPSNVCIVNQFTSSSLENFNGHDTPVSIHVNDVSFVEDQTPLSQKFKMDTLADLNDGLKMINQFKTERGIIGEMKKRQDVMELAASLKLVSRDPLHGIAVMSNQKESLHEKVTMKFKTIKEGVYHIDIEMPEETDHACGEEWHRVRLSYEMNYGAQIRASAVSPSLLALTLDSTNYQGEDHFCNATEE